MSSIRAFRGFRPTPESTEAVASPPYDVINTAEARALARGNPLSFLHVVRPEIDLPEGTPPYADEVYATAARNLQRLITDGVLVPDPTPCLYAYRQQMGDHVQTGIVAAASVDDYLQDIIKKHEHTRRDKEDDRTRHVDECDANTGPVFLTYRARPRIDAIVDEVTAGTPACDFEADGVRHTVWVIADAARIEAIEESFEKVPELYVADGHHRSASAARVGNERREKLGTWTGQEPFNRFLAVLFPDEQLRIMDYNRVVADLNGLDVGAFLDKIRAAGFEVTPYSGEGEARPDAPRRFGMYLAGRWYRLAVKPSAEEAADPVRRLDVSLLQERLLGPVLGIEDPRTDKRIDFVGGIRGLGELVRRVDEGGMAVAFAMHPTTIAELMAIADAGQVMPPKSTWFEPKLRSGLIVHKLS